MFYYIQSFLLVVIEALCYKLFFEIFEKGKTKEVLWKKIVLFMVLVLGLYNIVNRFSEHFAIKQLLIIIFISLYMKIYLKITLIKSLILTIVFQGLLLALEYVLLVGNVKLLHSIKDLSDICSVQGLLFTILGKVVLFLVVIMIRKLLEKDADVELSDVDWLRFMCFPLFTIFTIISLMITAENVESFIQQNLFVAISLGLAGMNLVVFYLLKDILKREKIIREDSIFRLQVKNQTSMYRSISENFDRQRRKTHEYKNQMMCIEALIKKKEYGELEKYIEGINDRLTHELDIIATNHIIVDAILNTKYQEMVSKNIVFVFKINDLSKISVRDEDIIVILSNLLNNAVEACEKCNSEKIVKLKLVKEDDIVIISVRNTYDGKVIYDGEEIQTSKKENKEEHGIGIKNIVETINKYNGSYVIDKNEEEFCFSVIIPE